MLYSVATKSGSLREIKKFKKIRAKYYKKGLHSSRDSSSDDSGSDPLLASDISWDTYRRTSGRKETNKPDLVVTNNLQTIKYQLNEAINNEPTFDTNSFNLSSGTSNPLPVVTVYPWIG